MPDIKAVIDRIDPAYGKYISVGDGWKQIVCDCDAELAQIDPYYRIFQVKEKYGELRYYFEPSDTKDAQLQAAMYEIVRKYKKLASQTCEESGLSGVMMKSIGGWFKTLNPEYASKKHPHAGYTEVQVSY